MPTTTSSRPRKAEPKKGETPFQIRGVPKDLQGRIAGAAGHLQMGKDEFVAELLRRSMKRFEKHQRETRDWWDTWEVVDSEQE